ncbi:YkgJ family cysteine cluster protein [Natronococcus sp.]|uniref:YkgJ family cysteine cluster protein n=1 Tax=Natronococcus sp. TaxID=35747 RepID=UPI0025CDEB42|nr:YkgJ family cysteine cluster protein [Natronococcus sp.]
MEVNCRGCAGCCLDWRPLLEVGKEEPDDRRCARSSSRDDDGGNERAFSDRVPLGGSYNFVALARDEVRTVLERGSAAALTPRFWTVEDEREGVEIGDRHVAAVAGRPVFFVGLRKPPKPVAPFGREGPTWLPTCVFLDPTTLQCRVHGSDRFPDECGTYPEQTLALGAETECERVEARFGGDRLLERNHDDPDGLLFGPQALGAKLFCHPRPDELEGLLDRLERGEPSPTDRAKCIAVAAASSPGTVAVSEPHYERALERLEGDESGADDAWIGAAIGEWHRRRDRTRADEAVPDPELAAEIEDRRGAPETPGWE